MRAVFERARAADLSSNDWKVLSVVVAYTAGWSRLADGLTARRIAREAGLSERRTRDRLKKLDELKLIVWTPRAGNPSFGSQVSEVSLPAAANPDALSVRIEDDPNRTPLSVRNNPDVSGRVTRTPRSSATREVIREVHPNVVVDEEQLMKLLDKLGFTTSQRARALAEDHDRVMAWLERAQEPDVLNPAAYAWSGITAGDWPTAKVSEVRGSHGTSVRLEDKKSKGPWEVYALNGNDEAMHLVGRFDDLAEARRVYAEHDERSGATLMRATP
ncbi:MAG: hypothetical protein AABM30_09290 [Actinomycetota bacterium]